MDDPDLMLEYARSLSFEQRIVFDKIIKFCKQVKRSNKGEAAAVPKPPQLIVKGKYIISYICVY